MTRAAGALAQARIEELWPKVGDAHDWRELLLDLTRRGLFRRTGTDRRRWSLGILEGPRRGLAVHARTALLGSQDRQCLEQASQKPAA